MSHPRYLTKSRFKLAVECPTKLYYTGKPEYANTNNENEFLAMLADGGFQVGELAKLMYPDGVEIKSKRVAEAVAETERLLQLENITLFEPAIVNGSYLVRVDVLVKRGQHIEVIEVKAKSYSGDHGRRHPALCARRCIPKIRGGTRFSKVHSQRLPAHARQKQEGRSQRHEPMVQDPKKWTRY